VPGTDGLEELTLKEWYMRLVLDFEAAVVWNNNLPGQAQQSSPVLTIGARITAGDATVAAPKLAAFTDLK
jgi:hypothetical protein